MYFSEIKDFDKSHLEREINDDYKTILDMKRIEEKNQIKNNLKLCIGLNIFSIAGFFFSMFYYRWFFLEYNDYKGKEGEILIVWINLLYVYDPNVNEEYNTIYYQLYRLY